MFKKLSILLSVALLAGLAACGNQKRSDNEILVGTIAGPETTIMEVAQAVAKDRYGLKIKIITFNDYVLPNQALADGSIDANMYQHEPYLQETIATKGYQLISIGKTFVYPMGIYSKKIKQIRDLKPGSTVAISNDPSNQTRALLLLERAGVIGLEKNVENASIHNIKDNPFKLQFKELDAAQLPRVLNDVDIAAINTNYAMMAGLLPSKDAFFMEKANSPYANVIVIREKDKNLIKYKSLARALHSPEVLEKAKELFKGQAIKAW